MTVTEGMPYFVATLFEPRPAWYDEAACRGVDPALFHPARGDSTREAKAVCERCPISEQCLEYALANVEKFGIWGGKSERERRIIRRERARVARRG